MSITTPALSKTELDNKKFWEKQRKPHKDPYPDLTIETGGKDRDWERELVKLQHEKEHMQDLGTFPTNGGFDDYPKAGREVERLRNAQKSDTLTPQEKLDHLLLSKAGINLIKDPNTSTVRADGGKPSTDLLPPKPLLMIAQALTLGASKYTRTNWLAGMAWSRCYASCLRHLFAWWSGETYDKETGLNHLAHAACNILFLLQYAETSTGTDDRLFNGSV